jgi:predicted metal-dependent peptidase
VDSLKDQVVSRFVNLGIRKDLNDLDSMASLTEEQVDRKIEEEDSAKRWIIETLQGFGGSMEMTAVKIIHEQDEKMKVSWRTLLRKADQLGVKKESILGAKDNRKMWVLPDELMPDPGMLAM